MTNRDQIENTATVNNINTERQAMLRQCIAQAEREPTHWVVRLGYGGRFTTWLGFQADGEPVAEFSPEKARQYSTEARCYAIARRTRNRAGERGEVVTYLQALRDELAVTIKRGEEFDQMMAELKAQAE